MAPFGGIERRAFIVILASLLAGLGILGIRAVQATGGAAGDTAGDIIVAGDGDSGAGGVITASHGTELPAPTEIVVHVCGAVKNPGVYRMAPSSRVADAVAAAGGGTASAYFEHINLASPIFDGQQIYVPIKGESPTAGNGQSRDVHLLSGARNKTIPPAAPRIEAPAIGRTATPGNVPIKPQAGKSQAGNGTGTAVPAESGPGAAGPAGSAALGAPAPVAPAVPELATLAAPGFAATSAPGLAAAAGLIDLNMCSSQELTTLKGIGPVLAQRIIEYRAQHGRFMSVDELLEVPGIGPKKLESIRPYVGIR